MRSEIKRPLWLASRAGRDVSGSRCEEIPVLLNHLFWDTTEVERDNFDRGSTSIRFRQTSKRRLRFGLTRNSVFILELSRTPHHSNVPIPKVIHVYCKTELVPKHVHNIRNNSQNPGDENCEVKMSGHKQKHIIVLLELFIFTHTFERLHNETGTDNRINSHSLIKITR